MNFQMLGGKEHMAILLDEEESVVKIAGSGGKWNYGAT